MAKREGTTVKMSPKRNFFDTITFLYVCGKLFGVSCYSVSKDGKKYKVSFQISDFLQLITFLAVYSALIYYNLENKLHIANDAKNAVIFNSAQQILIIISLMFLIGGLIKIVLDRHRFWKIVNTLRDIDIEMLQLLKIQINHKTLYRHTLFFVSICYLTLVMVYIALGSYFFMVVRGMIIHYILSFLLCNAAFIMITIQFQVLMYSMYMRFSTLNEFVESSIPLITNQEMPSSTINLDKYVFFIARINDELNQVVPTLSSYFSTFMIPAIGGVFCITVFNFHNFYRAISENSEREFYLLIISYEMISIFFNILVSLCIIVSSINTSAAKKMGVLVHKIIARTNNQDFILKLKVLSQQILHRSPNVSFGIISLNWSFGFSYIASVASFLIILIQFENYIAESSNNGITSTKSNFEY